MKRKTWYCYRLEEKRSKCDKPYYGKTYDLKSRAKRWQKALKLDYIPELYIEYTDTSEQRVFDFEQEKRVANCWPRERSLRHQRNIRKKGGKVAGKRNVQSGHLASIASLGGKIGGKISGKRNVESGHLASIASLGGKVSGKKAVESGRMQKLALTSAKARALLTKEQAEQIKKEYIKGSREYSTRALAKKYGVHQNTIYRIVNNRFKIY